MGCFVSVKEKGRMTIMMLTKTTMCNHHLYWTTMHNQLERRKYAGLVEIWSKGENDKSADRTRYVRPIYPDIVEFFFWYTSYKTSDYINNIIHY